MKRETFSKWGADKGFGESWTINQLDNSSYNQFLLDLLPQFPFKTTEQLNAFIRRFGGSMIRNDQSLLYEYLFPQNLPYKDWNTQLVKKVMTEEAFSTLQRFVEKVKTKKPVLTWCDVFMRHALYEAPYLKELHLELTPLVEKVLQKRLTPSYSYLSIYSENGICLPHRDQSRCQWTLDLCVKQDKPWLLSVENSSFLMEENEGLIYSGTDQVHWREKIHPGGISDLVFFHFLEN